MGSLVTDFVSFIVLFLSRLRSLHFGFLHHVVPVHQWRSFRRTWTRVRSLRAFQGRGDTGRVEPAAHECAQRTQLAERRRGEAAIRRTKTHLWRENPIAWFGLALQFVLGREKHQIARLPNRAEKIEGLKNRLDDNQRRGELSRCHQGGATGVVAVVMWMRIV